MANNYWCTKHDSGWQVKREGDAAPLSTHKTQEEGWKECMRVAKAAKVEAILSGEDGKIRERNSYGNDPVSSKG